jgi:hypothetical protein
VVTQVKNQLRQMPRHRLLLWACCGVFAAVCGCAPTQLATVEAAMGLHWANSPIINAVAISATPERVQVVSIGRVAGLRDNKARWVNAGHRLTVGRAEISVETVAQDVAAHHAYMSATFGECPTAKEQLTGALKRIEPFLPRWYGNSELPRVRLRLPRPGPGYFYLETSAGASMSDSSMTLVWPTPERMSCPDVRRWVRDVVSLLVHEWMHAHIYQRYAGAAEKLADEFAASMVEMCADLVISSGLPERSMSTNWAGNATLSDVLGQHGGGQLSASAAGRLASDVVRGRLVGNGRLEYSAGEPLLSKCDVLAGRLFDLHDPKDVADLTVP